MTSTLTPQQALANLYNASKLARLTADEHAFLVESAKLLQEIIKTKETKEKEYAEGD